MMSQQTNVNTKLVYFSEPQLLFGGGHSTEDPRDGLTLFGPYEQFTRYSIPVGVVGTQRGVELYKRFVAKLQQPIYSKTAQRPSFPGFESVFGIEWPDEPAIVRVISQDAIDSDLSIPGAKERTFRLVNLYLDAIRKVHAEEEGQLAIWFVVVPQRVWRKCRSQAPTSPGEQASEKSLRTYLEGKRSLFPGENQRFEELSEILNLHSDFHHQLKARLLQEGITVPVQIALETTLQFRDKYAGFDYKEEMQAHLAWTQATTVYYKLGKLPWKLSSIRKGVCYLGLVFKRYRRVAGTGYSCSAAQMFLDSGDGTVFRGNIGPWQSRRRAEFHLNGESAKELLTVALDSYLNRRGEYPAEVFIHGRARFAHEEWQGFQEVIQERCPPTRLVGAVIKESGKLKLFRDLEQMNSKYGNLRGLGLLVDGREGFLWTRGFIPKLGTSISLEVPNPLRIQIDKGDGELKQTLQDILALSKLNYNACIYGDGVPVTLRFSDLIGSILTAVPQISNRVLPFKYYI